MASENDLSIKDFPSRATEKLRYGDTDRQGHVNNVVFAGFMETGRVEMLFKKSEALSGEGTEFVIVRLELDFLAEVAWPGEVEIGTMVREIGYSSFKLFQMAYQEGKPVARADSVIVQLDKASRRSKPLTEQTRQKLQVYQTAR